MSPKVAALILALCGALAVKMAQCAKLQRIEDLPVFPAESYETPLTRRAANGGSDGIVEDVPDRRGAGSYVTFRVEKCSGAEVAVKIVEDADELPYVMNEVLVLELLRDAGVPNVVRYRAAYRSEDNSAVYIVTDFVQGKTLADIQLHKDLAFTEEQIARCFASFLSTLSHLQKVNVLHRDIKPANLSIDDNRQLTLVDFGYAEILKKKNNFKVNDYVGSPFTMAPEALMAQEQDFKTDLWSAFAVLFMWLEDTENGPFEHLCTDECRAAHEQQTGLVDDIELARMSQKLEMSKKVPSMAQDLIHRVFTVDPVKRPSLSEVMIDPWFSKYGITFEDADKFHPRNITVIGIEDENYETTAPTVDTAEATVIHVNEQDDSDDSDKMTKSEAKNYDNESAKSGAEVDNLDDNDDFVDFQNSNDNDNDDDIDSYNNDDDDIGDNINEVESASSSETVEQESEKKNSFTGNDGTQPSEGKTLPSAGNWLTNALFGH